MSDGAAAPLYELHSRPDPRLTGPRGRARGLDRRGARCGRGGAGARRRPPPDRDRDVRRRPAARLPRTTPGDAPPRRREHVAHLARHRALRREGPRRAATCCMLLGHEPDSLWKLFTEQVVALARRLRHPARRRSRRVPVRRAAHSAVPSVDDRQLDRARRTPRLPAQLGRRPRGRRSGDRAELCARSGCPPWGSGRRCRTTRPRCPIPRLRSR